MNPLIKKTTMEYLIILLGSLLYGFATVFFIFPPSLFLGGTTGISVILTAFWEQSPGFIFTIINVLLLLLALIILGKSMALKTFIGSTLTTIFIAVFEKAFPLEKAPIPHPLPSAIIGAAIIACASALMFYVDSSSGGTDIIALIIKKFSDIKIGKALLLTDILIVIVGGIVSGWVIALSSFIGLLVKTLGIDFIIKQMKNASSKKDNTNETTT
jgi:uncharacterized membrane-anchored protein YitT (DUF2179 family)